MKGAQLSPIKLTVTRFRRPHAAAPPASGSSCVGSLWHPQAGVKNPGIQGLIPHYPRRTSTHAN